MREIKILITAQEIQNKTVELAAQISKDYEDKPLIVIGILKGSFVFMADLCRHLAHNTTTDFMQVSSYHGISEQSGELTLKKDIDTDISGKHVLIVEDILDTGKSLTFIKEHLLAKAPADLKIVTLLDKPERRIMDINADYVGFTIEDKFVIGYGLDYDEAYRGLPYVGYFPS